MGCAVVRKWGFLIPGVDQLEDRGSDSVHCARAYVHVPQCTYLLRCVQSCIIEVFDSYTARLQEVYRDIPVEKVVEKVMRGQESETERQRESAKDDVGKWR